jgi:hypothetical protein
LFHQALTYFDPALVNSELQKDLVGVRAAMKRAGGDGKKSGGNIDVFGNRNVDAADKSDVDEAFDVDDEEVDEHSQFDEAAYDSGLGGGVFSKKDASKMAKQMPLREQRKHLIELLKRLSTEEKKALDAARNAALKPDLPLKK